tara:strand:- start:31 stop:405 length:375 start_codon:yes stop_codon:yes gene_type:complete
MANTFIRKTSKAVGTSFFQVGANSAGASQTGAYTVGADTQSTVIGLSVSNVTSSAVDIDVALSATMANTTNDVSLCTSVPIPSGSTIVLVGGDQKLVLTTSDLIKIKSSASASLDVVMSMLEIT